MLLPRSAAKIPCTIPPVKTPSPLPLSHARYSGQDASLSDAPPREMELETSEPPLPFFRVGHRQRFSAQYSRAYPPASLLPPSSSSRISASVLILRLPRHPSYMLLSPLSRLSATSLLLLSRPPHVSAAVSTAILVHRPCHLACLIMLSSSTCVFPSVLIRRRLHHPVSLTPPSLLFYVSAASLLSLFPPSRVSAAIALPYCAPAPSRPPVTTERRNLLSWAPRFGRLGVCVLIGEDDVAIPVVRQPAIMSGRRCRLRCDRVSVPPGWYTIPDLP